MAAVRPEQPARLSFDDWLDAMFNQDQDEDLAVVLAPPPARPADRSLGGGRGRGPMTVVVARRARPRLRPAGLRAPDGPRRPGTLVSHARRRQPVADDARGRGGPRVQHRVPR